MSRLGKNHRSAASAEDLPDNGVGDGLWLERWHEEARLLVVAREQLRLHMSGMDDNSADLGGVVPRRQLGGDTLVQRQGTGLTRAVVDHVGDGQPGGVGGYGDDHAVVARDHVREERLGHPEGREGVDVKGEADVAGGRVEERLAAGDAGIVDDDGWVADLGADMLCYGGEFLGGANVALVVVDEGGCCCQYMRRSFQGLRESVQVVKDMGWISSTTTVTPISSNNLTMDPPIPPAPPVTRTISFFQSYLSLTQLLRTLSEYHRLAVRTHAT